MQIRTLVTELVEKEGRYLKAKEISTMTGIGLFSLYREIPEGLTRLQSELGITRDTSYLHTRENLIAEVAELIKEKKRFMPSVEISKELSISRSTFRKFNIDTSLLQESLGYCRNGKKPPGGWNKGVTTIPSEKKVEKLTNAEIIDRIISTIEKYGCYCPSRVISSEIGIPSSTLSFRGISTELINNQLGFTRTNRFFEFSVFNVLAEIFPDLCIIRQKWFIDCNSVDGNHLYFDFYIPELKLIIEADGPCHYQENHPWFTDKVKSRDAIKEEYCRSNEISLIRIRYQNKVTKEIVLEHLSGTPLELYKLQRSEKSQS